MSAAQIIERCGGYKTVAEWLGCSHTTVLRWTLPFGGRNKGAGNRIPHKNWGPLIDAARERGIEIKPEDLIPAEAMEAAARHA